jgi:hypothetical protein
MNVRKKVALFSALGFAALPLMVSADNSTSLNDIQNGISGLSIQKLGEDIINIVWIVFTVIAVIAFLIAGILFMTAMGDPEKIKNARNALIWGVVGVIVGILAFSIVQIIKASLGA